MKKETKTGRGIKGKSKVNERLKPCETLLLRQDMILLLFSKRKWATVIFSCNVACYLDYYEREAF